jgi:hypothetical protein
LCEGIAAANSLANRLTIVPEFVDPHMKLLIINANVVCVGGGPDGKHGAEMDHVRVFSMHCGALLVFASLLSPCTGTRLKCCVAMQSL